MTDRAHVLWIATAVMLVVALLVILSLVRRRRLRGKYGLFWLLVVLGFLPFAIEPDLVDAVGDRLGVRYQPALLMIAGIAVLTLLSMHFSWEVSRLEERSRAMAEELALLRAKVEESADSATSANLATDDAKSVVDRQERLDHDDLGNG